MEDEMDDSIVDDGVEFEYPEPETTMGKGEPETDRPELTGRKDVCVDIVDKEMSVVSDLLSDKFPQDYAIVIRYGDYTRKDLIDAVVEKLTVLVEGGDKAKLNAFVGWLCRTLNLDPAVFNDKAILEKELSLAQQNIDSLLENPCEEVRAMESIEMKEFVSEGEY